MTSPRDNVGMESAVELLQLYGLPVGPGTFIPAEHVETVLGLDRDQNAYTLAVITLRKMLTTVLEETQGRRYVIRMQSSGIRVLTTAEAAEHTHATFQAKRRAMSFWHNTASVCVQPYIDELDEQHRRRFNERQLHNARLLLQMDELETDASDQD